MLPPPPLPAPCAPDLIAARVAELAPTLNGGAWLLDARRSAPMAAFAHLMGAPLAVVQLIRLAGCESRAERTLALSGEGLADELVVAGGLLAPKRSERTQWQWRAFERPSLVGPMPAVLSFDALGNLQLVAQNVARGLLVTTTLLPVAPDPLAPSRQDVLVQEVAVTDAAGAVHATLRRYFTRARAGEASAQ
jgi:hypothetical protein